MQLLIKKLQGGECTVDVTPTTTIMNIKQQVAEKFNIPAEEQKLLLMGRTLFDDQIVQSYPLKDGSKLNLVHKVKKLEKPVGLYEVTYKTFTRLGLTHEDASDKAKKYVQIIEERFKKYSWDDIERLAEDCVRAEYLNIEQGLKTS